MRDKHLLLWAKASRDTPARRLSILQHGLDTAAVANEVLQRSAPALLTQMAAALGVSEALAQALLSFLAATHDAGKAMSEFQCRLPEAAALLRANGVRVDQRAFGTIGHAAVSEALLRTFLAQAGWGAAARRLSLLVGAHHGELAERAAVMKARAALRDQDTWWRAAQQELLQAAAELFPVAREQAGGEVSGEAFGLLAGLITAADWVASNECYFPLERRLGDPGAYYRSSRALAAAALDDIGWLPVGRIAPRALAFEELFGFAPRPLQAAAREVVAGARGPTLLLIEASTGEGKTEAAFDAAAALQRTNDHKGAYIGMPTQATGNQMFQRLTRFLDQHAAGAEVGVQLAHGNSRLNELARSLKRPAGAPEAAGVTVRDWFTRSKLALLAPYGVGTIDQALLAALNTHHFNLRLFGLSNTTVVLDEVHAYDLYTSGLLLRLLEWLKALGSSAVVMTATLPPSMRAEILKAWGAENAPHLPYPRVIQASASGVSGRSFEGRPVTPARLTSAPHTEPEVAAHLTRLVAGGGCAVAIASTVDRAIDIYRHLKADPANEGVYLALLHARFPAHERQRLESELTRHFGPPGPGATRPERAIVVATQVIEQSLDVDFDVMLSDPAPIDLLIQRLGRLHRHARPRPTAHATPTLHLAGHHPDRLPPTHPHAWVYGRHLLYRTWHAIKDKTHLHAPTDSDPLLQQVYEGATPPGLDAELARELEDAHTSHQRHQAELEARLRDVRMPPPEAFFDKLPPEKLPADELGAVTHAATRLGRESLTVIPLNEQPDGSLESLNGVTLQSLAHEPNMREAELMSETHLAIRNPHLLSSMRDKGVIGPWKENPHLRFAAPLILRNNTTRIGGWQLTLDPELGLVIQKGCS